MTWSVNALNFMWLKTCVVIPRGRDVVWPSVKQLIPCLQFFASIHNRIGNVDVMLELRLFADTPLLSGLRRLDLVL
jgi:hypothetical protein